MNIRDLCLVYVICVVWGLNFIAVATGLTGFAPFTFTALRFAMVLLVVLPFMRLPPPDQWPRLIVVALAVGAAHFAVLFWAMKLAPQISSVAILLQTYVPMTTILAVLVLGEQIGWRTIGAIVLAFSGVLVVSLEPEVFSALDSVILCLLAAFCLALGTMLMRGLKGVSALSYQGWTAAISIPAMLPLAWWLEPSFVDAATNASLAAWGGAIYSALFASIAGHGLLFVLLQRYPVTTVTPHLLAAPILAIVFGVLIWGDDPGWRLYVGGGMVLSGVLIVTLRARSRAQQPVVKAAL